jgi:4-carboxymuconolactone decarboxylase
MNENQTRYERGLDWLRKVDGRSGDAVVDKVAALSPDMAVMLVEMFGDVYSRPQLDLRSREIAVIAALTVLGYALPQLKVHVHAGLNVGLTPDEIREIILHMVPYVGFPATLNALFAAGEVLAEHSS